MDALTQPLPDAQLAADPGRDDADAPAMAPRLVDRIAEKPRKPLPPLNETWVRRRARWAAYKRTQAAKPEGS